MGKVGEGECFSIGGIYEVETLQPLLQKFIEKYLTCGSCCLPQVLITANHFMIQGKCTACGWLGSLDNGHKLAEFIKKNPPDDTGLNIACDGGRRMSKKERRLSLVRRQVEAEQESGDEDWVSEEDEVVPVKKKLSDKDEKSKKEERK